MLIKGIQYLRLYFKNEGADIPVGVIVTPSSYNIIKEELVRQYPYLYPNVDEIPDPFGEQFMYNGITIKKAYK